MNTLLVVGTELATDAGLLGLSERNGYELVPTAGLSDALVALRSRQPAVALVMHHCGQESGVEVLRELRRADPSCEVIVATGQADFDAAIEVLRAGALDYIQLPIEVKQLHLALQRAQERGKRHNHVGPPTILVVEDHDATRKSIFNVLRKEGYRVFAATDGEEALEIFKKERIDLIFSDLMMPGKSGLDVLDETKGAGADVEVIVATGHRDESLVVAALRKGAINFLKKPLELEHMLLAVKKAFEHLSLRRTLAARNRDVELMQELVLRLTHDREVIVEQPRELSDATFQFLHQLVDTLPFGVVVFDTRYKVRFANRHVIEKVGNPPTRLCADWLSPLGLSGITDQQLHEAVSRTLENSHGHVETLVISRWAFLLLTGLRILTPKMDERCLVMAIRGERQRRNGGT